MSFNFDKTVEIIDHACFLIYVKTYFRGLKCKYLSTVILVSNITRITRNLCTFVVKMDNTDSWVPIRISKRSAYRTHFKQKPQLYSMSRFTCSSTGLCSAKLQELPKEHKWQRRLKR